MAQIYGNPELRIRQKAQKMILLPVLVTVTILGFRLWDNAPLLFESRAANISLLSLVLLYAVWLWFDNKLFFRKFFAPRLFSSWKRGSRVVNFALAEAGEDTVVFRHLTLELLHVDALVISPDGVSVVRFMERDDPENMQKQLHGLWKCCHILHAILKKYFKCDYIPHPVLCLTGEENISRTQNEVAVVSPKRLLQAVESPETTASHGEWSPDIQHVFCAFVNKRYL